MQTLPTLSAAERQYLTEIRATVIEADPEFGPLDRTRTITEPMNELRKWAEEGVFGDPVDHERLKQAGYIESYNLFGDPRAWYEVKDRTAVSVDGNPTVRGDPDEGVVHRVGVATLAASLKECQPVDKVVLYPSLAEIFADLPGEETPPDELEGRDLDVVAYDDSRPVCVADVKGGRSPTEAAARSVDSRVGSNNYRHMHLTYRKLAAVPDTTALWCSRTRDTLNRVVRALNARTSYDIPRQTDAVSLLDYSDRLAQGPYAGLDVVTTFQKLDRDTGRDRFTNDLADRISQ